MRNFGHPDESFHENKQLLRRFLIGKHWRRCGRTKKFEVYKKKIGGEQFRVKFATYGPTLDKHIPKTEWDKAYWRNQGGSARWTNIHEEHDLEFMSIVEHVEPKKKLSEAEEDDRRYWFRLGVPA